MWLWLSLKGSCSHGPRLPSTTMWHGKKPKGGIFLCHSSSEFREEMALKEIRNMHMATFPDYIILSGPVNVTFKFILCTTFDFKADYTSSLKAGRHQSYMKWNYQYLDLSSFFLSFPPFFPLSCCLFILLTPSNSLFLILIRLSNTHLNRHDWT